MLIQRLLPAGTRIRTSALSRPKVSVSASTMSAQQQPGERKQDRKRQGDLVNDQLTTSPAPLVDIGVNLVDRSFKGVRGSGSVLLPGAGLCPSCHAVHAMGRAGLLCSAFKRGA